MEEKFDSASTGAETVRAAPTLVSYGLKRCWAQNTIFRWNRGVVEEMVVAMVRGEMLVEREARARDWLDFSSELLSEQDGHSAETDPSVEE
ncbi:hypothetical protein FCIRC_9852 [Fusarium circinatum]|uniref:Uncharacterized protein n=1 Tax=Fusarium circinatum TaxID=48490 RepID=A0A8H5TEM7_FUSCI|nr:hypothetical protein FCIRC_9852 [Fusarium circinatum]